MQLDPLKPCPHCGNAVIEISYSGPGHFEIGCASFACRSSTGIWKTEPEAIAAWNRRALPSSSPTEAEVEAALKAFNELPTDFTKSMKQIEREAMRAALLAALANRPAETKGEVKALEWVEDWQGHWKASALVALYHILQVSDGTDGVRYHLSMWWSVLQSDGLLDTLDAAKALAQADFEARIRSVLASPPVAAVPQGIPRRDDAARMPADAETRPVVFRTAWEIERDRLAGKASPPVAAVPQVPDEYDPFPDDDAPVADKAADYVLTELAKLLKVDNWTGEDGSESWEGDVWGTLRNILVKAGVIDEDLDRVADVPARSEIIEECAKVAGQLADEYGPLAEAEKIAANIRSLSDSKAGEAEAEKLVTKLRDLVDNQTEGDAVVLVQRQLFNRVVGHLHALASARARSLRGSRE